MKKVILTVVVFVAAGCQMSPQGFDRGAMRTALGGRANVKETTDSDVARVMDLKPQIKAPFKLGVYFIDAGYYRPYSYGSKWSGDDRDLTWLEPLKKEGTISEAFPVVTVATDAQRYDHETLKDIRLAAARYGADAVLVVNYATSLDEYYNFSSVLYFTVVGMFFVPGTHIDAMVIVDASLFDVRNEYMYLSSEAEGQGKQIGPQTIKAEDSIKKARSEAMRLLREDILMRMRKTF
jgi:rhombotail lipoprotein